MLNKLRPRVKIYIDPIANKISVHPNILTIIGLIMGIFSAYLFATGNLLAGGIFILLSGFFDIIDGAVARNHKTQSPFGSILDSTTDRLTDAFILIGIAYGGFVNWVIGVLAIVASFSVSYVRARMEAEGVKGDVGIAERAERLVIIMIGAFLTYALGFNFLNYAVILIVILGFFTVSQRIYYAWKQLKDKKPE
ncbi:MAG: CDP-alcohol phosphatidyltransferase family protein [Methanobacterium sp.]|nr:CDP-alcohol phosphatidyltransferase family protein [Methanobacterium sp.]